MKNLLHGERIKIEDYIKEQNFFVLIEIDSMDEFDFACFCLDDTGKISNDESVVISNKSNSPRNIVHTFNTRRNNVLIGLDLKEFTGFKNRLVFTGSARDKGNLSNISGGKVTFLVDGQRVIEYNFDGSNFNDMKTIVIFDIYHKDANKISVINSALSGGLDYALRHFGCSEQMVEALLAQAKEPMMEKQPLQESHSTQKKQSVENRQSNTKSQMNNKAYPSIAVVKKERSPSYVFWASALFVIVWFIVTVYYDLRSIDLLKEMKVTEAIIIEKLNEDGKLYLRLSPGINDYDNLLSLDNQYAEVTEEYYSKHNIGENIGVLLGKYETYRNFYFRKGQKFVSSEWVIENVYDSYQLALEANKSKKILAEAVINEKKLLEDGTNLFVVHYNDSYYNVDVSNELYNKYGIGQKIKCSFETVGEMTKFLSIIESK